MSSSDDIREDDLEGFEDPLFARGKKETRSAKQTRSGTNSTVVIALVALIGVDCAMTATAGGPRAHKAAAVAVRAVVPHTAAVLAKTQSLTWPAMALVILLILGRPLLLVLPRPVAGGLLLPAPSGLAALLLRRRTSISYHTGGLHGP